MIVQNTNPAMVCPETQLVHKGLAREDLFLCVHEQFLTETAAFADVVLPATMSLEHDDFYTASGHTYFQVAKKVIEPPGECRENHWVISELARRLGARHPGFEMSAWEIMDSTLRKSGMWDAETNWRRGGQDCALPFQTAHFLDGFPTADRRFHFKGDWKRFGGRWEEMPVLPDHFAVIDARPPTGPSASWPPPPAPSSTPPSRRRRPRWRGSGGPPRCSIPTIAPPSASPTVRRTAGQCARRSDRARPGKAGQQRGVVVVEGIWPNRRFEGGIGINALTSAEPGWPHGGAVFHDTAVSIRRA